MFLDFVGISRPRAPERLLSVGCGAGGLERDLARRFPDCEIVGIDISTAGLDGARQQAAAGGFERIRYERAAAVSYLERDANLWDGILCYGVLHHMENLEALLSLARDRLATGSRQPVGFLYAYEYAGPSGNAYSGVDLCWAERFFKRFPEARRRLARVAPPLAMEDPTEIIRSSEIEALLES